MWLHYCHKNVGCEIEDFVETHSSCVGFFDHACYGLYVTSPKKLYKMYGVYDIRQYWLACNCIPLTAENMMIAHDKHDLSTSQDSILHMITLCRIEAFRAPASPFPSWCDLIIDYIVAVCIHSDTRLAWHANSDLPQDKRLRINDVAHYTVLVFCFVGILTSYFYTACIMWTLKGLKADANDTYWGRTEPSSCSRSTAASRLSQPLSNYHSLCQTELYRGTVSGEECGDVVQDSRADTYRTSSTLPLYSTQNTYCIYTT